MDKCGTCGSQNTTPTTIKPPTGHAGPCTPQCRQPGFLCLNCRMFNERR